MKIKTIFLWLVLMPTIIFIDIICFLIGIFSKDVRRLYVSRFYNDTEIEKTFVENIDEIKDLEKRKDRYYVDMLAYEATNSRLINILNSIKNCVDMYASIDNDFYNSETYLRIRELFEELEWISTSVKFYSK